MMMKYIKKKLPEKSLIQALSGKVTEQKPCWLMRQAGRYLPEYLKVRQQAGGFLNLCYNPELVTEVTLQPIRRYDFDGAILFSDILVVCQAIGQEVNFYEGDGPKLSPLKSKEDFEKLSLTDFYKTLNPVFTAISKIKALLSSKTSFIGFSGGAWTLSTYMIEGGASRDFMKTKLLAWKEPILFQMLLDILVTAIGDYLIKQIDHGVEVIKIFDSWAGVLAETEFNKWVIEPTCQLVERIHKERPGIPIIGFPKGAGIFYYDFVKKTGVDGIALDQVVPIDWAIRKLTPNATIQGNLDPLLLVAGGDYMKNEVRRILDMTKEIPFIFNLGHGIMKNTPTENVAELMSIIRSNS